MNKRKLLLSVLLGMTVIGGKVMANAPEMNGTYKVAKEKGDLSRGADNFYVSNKVNVKKVEFKNIYGMKIVGNLFVPNNLAKGKKSRAIVVGHPFGAVKEQTGNLYAAKIAEKGYVTLTFDAPFWGESEGAERQVVAPELYAEAFSAAVDYLGTRDFVDREKIGVLGVCASGGFGLQAVKIDPRIKAFATISMVEMGTSTRAMTAGTDEQRKQTLNEAAKQRWIEAEGGKKAYTGGTANTLDENAPSYAYDKEFYDFYRTQRGEYTPKGADIKNTTKPTLTSNVKFLNFYPLQDLDKVETPLLFVVGEQAISRAFSEEAYKIAKSEKELYVVKNAGHVDLYDRTELIPFDKFDQFFNKYLK